MSKSPCTKECPKRTPTCHGECPDYIAFAIMNEIERDEKLKQGQLINDLYCSNRHYKKKNRFRDIPYTR